MARSDVRVRATCAALLVAAAACRHAPRSERVDVDAHLLPGDGSLRPPAFSASIDRLNVFLRRAADSSERQYATLARAERPLATDADAVAFVTEWGPPAGTRDTLIVRRRGLHPVRETLSFRGRTYRYAYDGAHVTGTVQVGDSAPRAFDRQFDAPVFAFNEVDALVRSLRYERGLRAVVPLFSEVDQAVEMDTLDVLGRGPVVAGDSTWLVRFADPAIVTTYAVHPTTRRIVDARTQQRRGGVTFHYVACDSCLR